MRRCRILLIGFHSDGGCRGPRAPLSPLTCWNLMTQALQSSARTPGGEGINVERNLALSVPRRHSTVRGEDLMLISCSDGGIEARVGASAPCCCWPRGCDSGQVFAFKPLVRQQREKENKPPKKSLLPPGVSADDSFSLHIVGEQQVAPARGVARR